ncbi:unnamed protein product, partial [Rotaria sordida]
KDGEPGKDGKNGKNGDPGKDGNPGKDGEDGKNGNPGKDGCDGKDDGKDGACGKDGINGKDGCDGKDGKNGNPGKDGKDGVCRYPPPPPPPTPSPHPPVCSNCDNYCTCARDCCLNSRNVNARNPSDPANYIACTSDRGCPNAKGGDVACVRPSFFHGVGCGGTYCTLSCVRGCFVII